MDSLPEFRSEVTIAPGSDLKPQGQRHKWAPDLPSRIPSLDGMRAISILLVVIAHTIDPDRQPAAYSFFGHLGNTGVRIFFLISGFLITGLLLREHDGSGKISLKNFYMRRVIRIFPAFYIFVFTVVLLERIGYLKLLPGDILHTLTYTMNYHMVRAWYLNHTWSLSVEEQFYLLWPAVVLWAGPARALRTTVAVICAVPLIRLGMYWGFRADAASLDQEISPYFATALGRTFQAVCDALATGCLLAGLYNYLGGLGWYRKLQSLSVYIFLPLGLLTLSAATYKIGRPLYFILGQSIANLGGILLLDYLVRNPQTFAGKLLNFRPLAYIGVWSYSIYLWQELFLDHDPAHLRFPLNLLAVAAVSLLSYYCIEKQFLKWRHSFRPLHEARSTHV